MQLGTISAKTRGSHMVLLLLPARQEAFAAMTEEVLLLPWMVLLAGVREQCLLEVAAVMGVQVFQGTTSNNPSSRGGGAGPFAAAGAAGCSLMTCSCKVMMTPSLHRLCRSHSSLRDQSDAQAVMSIQQSSIIQGSSIRGIVQGIRAGRMRLQGQVVGQIR